MVTGCLSESEVKEIEQFIPPYSPHDGGQLHEAGADEHHKLGQFWKKSYPHLFDQPYSADLYKVGFCCYSALYFHLTKKAMVFCSSSLQS